MHSDGNYCFDRNILGFKISNPGDYVKLKILKIMF